MANQTKTGEKKNKKEPSPGGDSKPAESKKSSEKTSRMTKGRVLATAAGVAAATAAGVVAVRKMKGDKEQPLKVFHVLPANDGWSVKAEGAQRAASTHSTKKEALDAARELVKSKEPSQLIIHRLDGSVQDAHTYQVEG